MEKRIGTIDAPELPSTLPANSQWLLGQGAGVWFCIDSTDTFNRYRIKRFAPNGEIDCDGIFEIEENGLVFDINKKYEFTHISHCAKCRILQNETIFIFKNIEHE